MFSRIGCALLSPTDLANHLEARKAELTVLMTKIEDEAIKKMPAEDQRAAEGPDRPQVLRKIKPFLTADPAPPKEKERPQLRRIGDIRRVRPYLLSHPPIVAVARRLISIGSPVFLDLTGLALGLYTALALRWIYYEHSLPLWGVPWKAEAKWLPFLALIMTLVFWRNGLYAAREFRAGLGRIVSSLALVALLTLAFGVGTGYQFHTYGLTPVAFVLTAALIGLLRASYEIVTRDIWGIAGVRRRAVLVGEGDNVAHLRHSLGSGRGGIAYEFVGAIFSSANGVGLPVLGPLETLGHRAQRFVLEGLIDESEDFALVYAIERGLQRAPTGHVLAVPHVAARGMIGVDADRAKDVRALIIRVGEVVKERLEKARSDFTAALAKVPLAQLEGLPAVDLPIPTIEDAGRSRDE